jgi:hypothetical protein
MLYQKYKTGLLRESGKTLKNQRLSMEGIILFKEREVIADRIIC